MRDPHIVALRYKVVPDKTVSFQNPPPLERETKAFRLCVGDDVATFEMKEHHSSIQEAQERVRPYLHAWDVYTALSQGRREIGFEFESADIIDRDPPPPGAPQVIKPIGIDSVAVVDTPTIHITRGGYPAPPDGFKVSPNVDTMWNRYEGYLAGREPLASMAYMCLTVLEASAGGRKEAAEQYGIARNVLDTLARLTSEVGDERTARKIVAHGKPRPHTGAEVAWIEATIKMMTLRVGEWAFDSSATRPKLTMADLPELM